MNKLFFGVIGFVTGAAIGAASTYFIFNKKLKTIADNYNSIIKKTAESFNETVQKEVYNKLTEQYGSNTISRVLKDSLNSVYGISSKEQNTEYQSDFINEFKKELGIGSSSAKFNVDPTEEFNAAIEKYNRARNDPDHPGWDDEEIDPDLPEKDDQGFRPPYRITDTQYIDIEGSQEKITAVYYAEDEVLCEFDSQENVIDIGSSIGFDNLTYFSEAKTIYIRNEKLGVDYEIIFDPSSYAASVHNIFPDDEDRAKIARKNAARRKQGIDYE